MKFDRWMWRHNASVWVGFDPRKNYRVEARYWSHPWQSSGFQEERSHWVRFVWKNIHEDEILPATQEAWNWLKEQAPK